MTQDEIIEMARQALKQEPREDWNSTAWVFADETLQAFANLVAKHTLMNIDPSKFMSHHEGIEAGRLAEREACAKLCEEYAIGLERNYSEIIADKIRARGE